MDEHSFFRFVPEKAISFLAPTCGVLAEAKGRPPALAEAMSDKDLKVYHVRNLKTGQETYISERDFDAAPEASGRNWERLPPPATTASWLLTGQEAAEVGLADALVRNRDELAKRYGLANCTSSSPPASISPWSSLTGG